MAPPRAVELFQASIQNRKSPRNNNRPKLARPPLIKYLFPNLTHRRVRSTRQGRANFNASIQLRSRHGAHGRRKLLIPGRLDPDPHSNEEVPLGRRKWQIPTRERPQQLGWRYQTGEDRLVKRQVMPLFIDCQCSRKIDL